MTCVCANAAVQIWKMQLCSDAVEEEKAQLEEKIAQEKEKNAQLEENRAILEERTAQLRKEIKVLKGSIQNLESTNKQLKLEKAELQEELDSKAGEVAHMKVVFLFWTMNQGVCLGCLTGIL